MKCVKIILLLILLSGCATNNTPKLQPSASAASSIDATCSTSSTTWLFFKNKDYVGVVDNAGKEHDKKLKITKHTKEIMKDKSIDHTFNLVDHSYDQSIDLESISHYSIYFNEDKPGEFESYIKGLYSVTQITTRLDGLYKTNTNIGKASVLCTLNSDKSPY